MCTKEYHTVFHELNLLNGKRDKKDKQNNEKTHNAVVNVVDVLQQLLTNESITPDDIRKAYSEIQQKLETQQFSQEMHQQNGDEKQESKPNDTNKKDTNNFNNNNNNNNNNFRTRHVALKFYYDGAQYSGLAQNLGQESDNSVEKQIFQALYRTNLVIPNGRDTCGYSRCGRTDRGVSSAGQVIALQLKSSIPLNATWDKDGCKPVTSNDDLPKNSLDSIQIWAVPKSKPTKKRKQNQQQNEKQPQQQERIQRTIQEYDYAKILNNVLPPDIRIFGWCPVTGDFSARFSATNRTYRYFFVSRETMNLSAMRQGLQLLIGNHDFRNFCKMDVEKVYNFERKILSAELIEQSKDSGDNDSNVCYFQIVGQAFLWHQIRCIVSILFLIGKDLESPSIITELLNVEKNPGKPGYDMAPELPLVLHDCGYQNLQMGHSVQNLWSVTCRLESQWEELILSAARVRNCLNAIQNKFVLHKDAVEFATNKVTERQKKSKKLNIMDDTKVDEAGPSSSSSVVVSWKDCIEWFKQYDLHPGPDALKTIVHVPLLQRSRGTTKKR